jgi:CRISPR system Cascade subunit CasA
MNANLLTDPIFRVELAGQSQRLTLPDLLESLGQDQLDTYGALQRHQEDAWHIFLCYLGAALLARHGKTSAVQRSQFWEAALSELAGDTLDAWALVSPNPRLAAFMQPPLPVSDIGRLKVKAVTPDALDLLVTSKNHDVKAARATRAQPDDWVYALVSLQTMSGYLGAGNRGISRMNSGFGNRLVVELVQSFRWGRRWIDAVERLLAHRQELLAAPYHYDSDGLVLLWTVPWDGVTPLPLTALDPCFIEVCRRVRLRSDGEQIWAEDVSCQNDRIDAKQLLGVLGDPWLPTELGSADSKEATAKALTVSPRGLTADVMRRLVFGDDLGLSALQRPGSDWARSEMWLLASVLVRGQGKTEGFYAETVRIPPQVVPTLFGGRERRQHLTSLSKAGLDYASKTTQALRRAVFVYLEGGPATVVMDRTATGAWWIRADRAFEQRWRADYFPWVWDHADDDNEQDALTQWVEQLTSHALSVLHDVEVGWPHRAGRAYRAQVEAERTFFGILHSPRFFPWMRKEMRQDV